MVLDYKVALAKDEFNVALGYLSNFASKQADHVCPKLLILISLIKILRLSFTGHVLMSVAHIEESEGRLYEVEKEVINIAIYFLVYHFLELAVVAGFLVKL